MKTSPETPSPLRQLSGKLPTGSMTFFTAFPEIGGPTPELNGTIDSLALLTQRFGRRSGDMKVVEPRPIRASSNAGMLGILKIWGCREGAGNAC